MSEERDHVLYFWKVYFRAIHQARKGSEMVAWVTFAKDKEDAIKRTKRATGWMGYSQITSKIEATKIGFSEKECREFGDIGFAPPNALGQRLVVCTGGSNEL